MTRKSIIWSLVLVVLTFAVPAQTNRQLEQEKTDQKRVALVIGNGAYQKAKVLPNPANDAADMAQTLKSLGFEVISGVNQNKRQMETLIREFGAKLSKNGGVGLFYYAGHGIQMNGENYLVPVEADIPEEDEVDYAAVPVSLVLTKMTSAKNELNIVILDACRNNPFARSWRTFRDGGNSDGLAKLSPPTGTLVLYASEPGKVASDGAPGSRNGLFTEALLKQIKKPNLEYNQMVTAVSAEVWQKSNKQQFPWKEGNSLQEFYFVGSTTIANTNTKPADATEPVIVAKDKAAQEREAWDLVKNSSDAEDFRFFLKEFPDGANAEKAKIRLEEIIWTAVKNSSDKAKVQAYLNEFPSGANSATARIKMRQMEMVPVVEAPPKRSPLLTGPYSLTEVLSILLHRKTSIEERNEVLLDGIKANGVNFPALPETEKKLIESGASDQLIGLIRQKSPNVPNLYAPGAIRRNSIGMEFAYIPSGEFMMGATEDEISEALYESKNVNKNVTREAFSNQAPKHKVRITNGFWMGRFEVTQKQWERVMGNNPSDYKDCGGAECPVEQVSWSDVQIFLKRLTAMDTQYNYRLPTEAEWEYACRSGTTTTFAFGTTLSSRQARFDGRFPSPGAEKGDFVKKTAPVGSYQPNAWGLYDMHGNVWEWVEDWYGVYSENESIDPTGPKQGTYRVIRGGSWVNLVTILGSSVRAAFIPDFREANGVGSPLKRVNIGFRIVAVPK